MSGRSGPPRLTGPRMAVQAYFPFDDRLLDDTGADQATWAWAMGQWARVAGARRAVRLVLAGQSYSEISATTPDGPQRLAEAAAAFTACRAEEQIVCGQVYMAGGKLPAGAPGQVFTDPRDPQRQVLGFEQQIRAWAEAYGNTIDGIYLDAGPRDCTDPTKPGHDPAIRDNYLGAVSSVRDWGYRVVIDAGRYADNDSSPWLDKLGADFVVLWNAGVAPYVNAFQAVDHCSGGALAGVPGWWRRGAPERYRQVHVVSDCLDATTMRNVVALAISDERASNTVWVTRPRNDPFLGIQYDVLPPYFDEEVALFQYFVDQEEKDATDSKEEADELRRKADADTAKERQQKIDDDFKAESDIQRAKDEKDEKYDADTKVAKDNKDTPDDAVKAKPEDKEIKEDKDYSDAKNEQDDKPYNPETYLKDSEQGVKTLEAMFGRQRWSPPGRPPTDVELRLVALEEALQLRTFIQPDERPSVGDSVVADPDEEEAE